MRTSRTFFICLCLLASLSFANEIPLILEETIQLPDSTPYWDVLPHWYGNYYWMSAFEGPDTNTVIVWGNTNESTSDTLLLENRGAPTGLAGFYNVLGEPIAITSTLASFPPFIENVYDVYADSSWLILLNLINGSAEAPILGWRRANYITNYPHYRDYTSGERNRLLFSASASAPPEMSNRVTAIIGWRNWHSSSDSQLPNYYYSCKTEGKIIQNMLDPNSYSSASFCNCDYVSSTQWANSCNLTTWRNSSYEVTDYSGHIIRQNRIVYPVLWDICDTVLLFQDIDSLVFEVYGSTLLPHLRSTCSVFDIFSSRITLVESWYVYDELQARSYEYNEPLWTLPGVYSPLLPAYVLIGDYSEQVLAYDAERQLFDIIRIEDGSIWGQTSQLPNGYNEMKIIGRYHNNYRRLAVRYGDEIRVFSFGDPVITDADDTPTIPHSYLFTAYPNPFNPSTTLEFSLPVYEDVRLSIFNTIGQEVAVLTDEQHSPGKYSYPFDASALPSGIYFARLSINASQTTKKLVLLK